MTQESFGMTAWFKKIWARLVAVFVTEHAAGSAVMAQEEPVPSAAIERSDEAKRPARAKIEREHFGAHYYLSDLLDQIGTAFQDMHLIGKVDKDCARVLSSGALTVSSSDGKFCSNLKDGFSLEKLPAIGGYYGGRHDEKDRVAMRIGYFVKESRPVNVQCSNHEILRCVAIYEMRGRPYPLQFFVAVSKDGEITLLKECRAVQRKVSKPRGAHPAGILCRMEWCYPAPLVEAYAEYKQRENATESLNEWVALHVAFMINLATSREAGLTVRVSKGGKSLAFSIDMLRTPYFFQDREKTVTENGRVQRVFHVVRPHVRGGKMIKAHFRGIRRFKWNGYDVNILLAGHHFGGLNAFDAAAIDDRDRIPTESYASMDELADVFSRAMDR